MRAKPEHHHYLISLYQMVSIVALIAGILVFCCTMAAVAVKIQVYAYADENRLHFFTVQANLLSAVGAAFMIPFAIQGIRQKRFVLPRWLVVFQYAGATCVAITLLTALLLILPVEGTTAVTGTDFWLHLVAPLCTITLYQCVETDIVLDRRDTVIAQVPFWIYMIIYYVEVVVIGKANGGWSDFYKVRAYFPAWVSVLVMLAVGFGIASLLRVIHNRSAALYRNRITRHWSDGMDPVELRTEAFGLGRYMGAHCDVNDLVIPVEIFTLMAERFDVTIDELTAAFVKGAMDAMKERSP